MVRVLSKEHLGASGLHGNLRDRGREWRKRAVDRQTHSARAKRLYDAFRTADSSGMRGCAQRGDGAVLGRLQLGHRVHARQHLPRDRVVDAVVAVLRTPVAHPLSFTLNPWPSWSTFSSLTHSLMLCMVLLKCSALTLGSLAKVAHSQRFKAMTKAMYWTKRRSSGRQRATGRTAARLCPKMTTDAQ